MVLGEVECPCTTRKRAPTPATIVVHVSVSYALRVLRGVRGHRFGSELALAAVLARPGGCDGDDDDDDDEEAHGPPHAADEFGVA